MQDVVEQSVDLSAAPARVWHALTDHAAFGRWFGVNLDGPFVVGGIVRGNVTYPGYEHMPSEARVEALEPKHRIVLRWVPYADPPATFDEGVHTVVEFRLAPLGDGTRLMIRETGFANLPAAARWQDARRMNEQGWREQAGNIAAHVDG